MENFITVLCLIAFGYFIYRKVVAARKAKAARLNGTRVENPKIYEPYRNPNHER